jgi:hypothetical protein
MKSYRVTYTESILRQTIVEASTPEQAVDAARAEYDDATHHHAVDVWLDDWQSELDRPRPAGTRTCFECGQLRG